MASAETWFNFNSASNLECSCSVVLTLLDRTPVHLGHLPNTGGTHLQLSILTQIGEMKLPTSKGFMLSYGIMQNP